MSADGLSARQAYLVLNALPNIGPITLNRLLETFGGDPGRIFSAPASELEAVKGVGPVIARTLKNWTEHFDLEREEGRIAKAGASFLACDDPAYPGLLREIHDPPIGLYALGAGRCEEPCIAIIGSRRTTLYGQTVARRFAAELARLGFCVVSGLARGIDTAAHEGALEAGGRTAAVLGNGIDIVYPPENLDLYRRIAADGVVLTEFPFGRRADKQSFPMRNRVVSGLCRGIVVVETDEKGGSMITARFAGEQGRSIMAVPGRVDQATSRGCHQLIRDGAVLCTSVEDILQELNYLAPLQATPGMGLDNGDTEGGGGDGDELLACFDGGGILSAEELAVRTGIEAADIGARLLMLELQHRVVKRADGRFEAR